MPGNELLLPARKVGVAPFCPARPFMLPAANSGLIGAVEGKDGKLLKLSAAELLKLLDAKPLAVSGMSLPPNGFLTALGFMGEDGGVNGAPVWPAGKAEDAC